MFSYLPPINLLAYIILLPLSWLCSPRTLHRINVFAIRLTVGFWQAPRAFADYVWSELPDPDCDIGL